MRQGWKQLILAAALSFPVAALAAIATGQRGTTQNKTLLEVNGYKVGMLKSANKSQSASNAQVKATVGLQMGKGLEMLMTEALAGNPQHISGFTITNADFNYKATSVDEYHGNAHLTEVTLPAMVAAGKGAVYIQATLQADQLRTAKGSGASIRGNLGVRQKAWLANNFKLDITGFGTLAKCVTKTSAIHATFGQGSTPQFDNLTVTLRPKAGQADAAQTWFNNNKGKTLTGSLIYLEPNLSAQLGSVKFTGLVPEKFSANGALATITFSIQSINFSVKGQGA